MAATTFSELYELVRVATGNDDPIIGPEILPDSRIDVLLRTAAFTLNSYSPSFPAVELGADSTTIIVTGDPDTALTKPLKIALLYVAAHRYFVGINNKQAVAESLGMIYAAAEAVSGQANIGVTEEDLSLATIYKSRKRSDAASQVNLK